MRFANSLVEFGGMPLQSAGGSTNYSAASGATLTENFNAQRTQSPDYAALETATAGHRAEVEKAALGSKTDLTNNMITALAGVKGKHMEIQASNKAREAKNGSNLIRGIAGIAGPAISLLSGGFA